MATLAEKAMTKIILDKFNKGMAPVQKSSKAKSSEFSDVKIDISNINPLDFTPTGDFQSATDSALDSAFKSSAWLAADDATDKIQSIQTKCDILDKLGITQAIDKIGSGLMDDVGDAVGDAIAAARASTGFSMPEFGIGELLSDLVNKGSVIGDAVATEFSGTVSAILETGKGIEARAKELINQVGGVVSDAVGDRKSVV